MVLLFHYQMLTVTMVMKTEILCSVFINLPTPDKSTNVLTQINQQSSLKKKGTINGKERNDRENEKETEMRTRGKGTIQITCSDTTTG